MPRGTSEPRKGEPIRRYVAKNGAVSYWTVLNYALPGQPRKQRRHRFDTLSEARQHVTEVAAARTRGESPATRSRTFDTLADELLEIAATEGLQAKVRKPVRPITLDQYRHGMKHARRAFGTLRVDQITEAHVRALRDDLVAQGRAKRTVKLVVWLVEHVLASAIRQGMITTNAATYVKYDGKPSREAQPLTREEVAAVTVTAADDRLHLAWLLTLRGLRRSEVLGLRWTDIDLDTGEFHIRHGRTGDDETLTAPKSKNSNRVLPIDPELLNAFRSWRVTLADEFGTPAVAKSAFVVVDDLGRPMRPYRYSALWRQLCHRAGIRRRVRTHEARHTLVTHLRDNTELALRDRDIAAWAGHDEETMRTIYDQRRQVNRGKSAVADAIRRIGEGA